MFWKKICILVIRKIFIFTRLLTCIAFLVSSNWRRDLTNGSTCFIRSSIRANWFSIKFILLSNSSQCWAKVASVSRLDSKLSANCRHSVFKSVFCFSIVCRFGGSAWRKITWARSLSKSRSPWWDYMNKEINKIRIYS